MDHIESIKQSIIAHHTTVWIVEQGATGYNRVHACVYTGDSALRSEAPLEAPQSPGMTSICIYIYAAVHVVHVATSTDALKFL